MMTVAESIDIDIQLLDEAKHDIKNYSDRVIVICRSTVETNKNNEV